MKATLLLSISLLIGIRLSAQTDTTLKKNLSIVVSPTLLAAGNEEIFVEYRPMPELMLMGGLGYNEDILNKTSNSSAAIHWGLTLNAAILTPTGKSATNFIGIMYSYRYWSIENEWSDGNLDFRDVVIDPANSYGEVRGNIHNNNGNVVGYIYNGSVHVACFDVMDILKLCNARHFISQLYAGLGYRVKYISLINTLNYEQDPYTYKLYPVAPNPPYNDKQITGSLDIKLGFLIGYKF